MRGGINMMIYTYIVVLVDFLITGIESTICNDVADSHGFTNVLTMCRRGTLTAGRVLVDTYDTGVLDLASCQCTVSLSAANTGPVNLEISAYPGTTPTSKCGSRLSFNRFPTNTFTEYRCQRLTGDSFPKLANNELLYITLTRSVSNIQWQDGYCIFIKSDENVNVTCEDPRTLLPASTTKATSTADVTTGYYKSDQSAFPVVAVLVLLVVTLLLVVLATVANVILYKRRLTLVTELNAATHGKTSSDIVHYDSIDQSRVEPPNTYEEISTGEIYVNTAM